MPTEPQWHGTGVLTEQANSPVWNVGDKITATTIEKGQYEIARASLPPKGTLGTGDYAGMVVASATCVREKGGIGVLTITYERTELTEEEGATVPPDEPDGESDQQEFALANHPQFVELSEEEVALARNWADATDEKELAYFESIIEGLGDDRIRQLANRLKKGQTHYKYDLPRYVVSAYYVGQPEQETGGYFDYPFGPMTVPPGWEWLRLPDLKSRSGSYWKLTRRWQATINPDTYIYPV